MTPRVSARVQSPALIDVPRQSGWLITYSGVKFYPIEPRQSEIEIEDIAHSLARLCRFAGHCREFYSVATHSFYVARLLKSWHFSDAICLAGLLHDAAEAYVVDVPSPLKRSPELAPFRGIEDRLQGMIFERFGVVDSPHIKKADWTMLQAEARALCNHADWAEEVEIPMRIESQDPVQGERAFMKAFSYFGGKS